MNTAALIVTAYGLFSLIGGVIGYVKARSAASLIAGSVSGALLLLCAAGIWQDNRLALLGGFAIALGLGGRFVKTCLQRPRIMPDGLMILFSAATLLAIGARLLGR